VEWCGPQWAWVCARRIFGPVALGCCGVEIELLTKELTSKVPSIKKCLRQNLQPNYRTQPCMSTNAHVCKNNF
jgi:hypothetical protein